MGKKNWVNILFNVITIVIAVTSLIVTICTTFQQREFERQLNDDILQRQEQFELTQKQQAAIPYFRVAHSQNAQAEMEFYEPNRGLQMVEYNGIDVREAYISVEEFYFENVMDNVAYINHVEYGNEAFELKTKDLLVKKGEVIKFSSKCRFIGLGTDLHMYIIVRTIYDQYFSYDCKINTKVSEMDTRHCEIEYIGNPVPYDIDNDIYKNREKHDLDIVIPGGGIVF